MAQRNNASKGIGAAMAQNAMLLPRALIPPNPLCAIGQRSRLTAPLGQSRTLTTEPAAGMNLTLKTRTADMPSQLSGQQGNGGSIALLGRHRVLTINGAVSHIDSQPLPGLAERVRDSSKRSRGTQPAGALADASAGSPSGLPASLESPRRNGFCLHIADTPAGHMGKGPYCSDWRHLAP
jgi:hypothetical protein